MKAAASAVASINDIVIGAVVYNPTDKDIHVIARNNILDTSGTRSFNVSNVNGELVKFGGVRALYNLSASGIYMTIPAGGYVTVNHTNIGALYDFEPSSTGTFTFEPIAWFQENSDTPSEVVDVPPVKVEVTNNAQVLQDLINEASLWANYTINHFPSTSPWKMPYFSGGRLDVMAYVFGDIAHYAKYKQFNCDSDPEGICDGSGGVILYTLMGYGPSQGKDLAEFNGDVGSLFADISV
ncbi:hypothetical protein C0993_009234 [Termitomyces sp. T159_Od127]|nr:hypothetical protein C0993_009234 [Termitomyces sp. T159_Od127]